MLCKTLVYRSFSSLLDLVSIEVGAPDAPCSNFSMFDAVLPRRFGISSVSSSPSIVSTTVAAVSFARF